MGVLRLGERLPVLYGHREGRDVTLPDRFVLNAFASRRRAPESGAPVTRAGAHVMRVRRFIDRPTAPETEGARLRCRSATSYALPSLGDTQEIWQ